MPREIDRKYGSGRMKISKDPKNKTETKNPGTKKRPLLTKGEIERSKRRIKSKNRDRNPGAMGNPAVVETYEDARENQMINRDIPTMKEGGICRGAGAAIKGTKFEGVF